MTVNENKSRIDRHSEQIKALTVTQTQNTVILKGIDKKLSDDFFDNFDELYRWAKVDNGKLSMNSWRRDIDEFITKKTGEENEAKAERKKWITWIVTFAAGALVNWAMFAVGK